ncbi:hypothetical protein N0V82_001024 [Gnomoniopsis sp. IMI 355080]|nr:hypothetical protein N0V82_001024 [Gnomoniopsis sp. IMI 355080]
MPGFENSETWSSDRTDESGGVLPGSGLSSPSSTAPATSPCASDDEDLTQVLRAVRKAKAQKAPDEQNAAAPVPVPGLPPELSFRVEEFFAKQIKSPCSFFKPTNAVPKNITPDGTNNASKRRNSYDPFAVYTLNIEPSEALESTRSKKKRRLDKTHQRSRTESQDSGVGPQKQGLGDGLTDTASQDPQGQSPAAPGNGESNTNNWQQRTNSTQPVIPRNTDSTTTPHTLDHPTGRQRSPATHHLLRGASKDGSQALSDNLHGYIGGHPEGCPSYAHKEANSLDQAVKKAKTRQVEYGSLRKKTAPDKHRSRQSLPTFSSVAEARLLRAQQTSEWKEAPSSSAQTALQNVTTRPGVIHPHRVIPPPPSSQFRQSKDANHQPTLEVEDVAATSPLHLTPTSGSQSRRNPRPQNQPLPRSSRITAPQPVLNNGDGFAGPQEIPPAAKTSQASHQVQKQMRQMQHSMLIPSRPRNAPAQISRDHEEDWDRVAAEMTALSKRYEDKPRTTLLNSIPAGLSESPSSEIRRLRGSLGKARAKIQESPYNKDNKVVQDIKKRAAAIRRDVRAKWSGESQEVQQAEFDRKFNLYMEKKKKEAMRQRGDARVSAAKFNAAFLEAGHNDEEANDHQDIGRKAREIPALEALERLGPNKSICSYIVLVSEPFSKGEKNPELIATKRFFKLTLARKYARSILDVSKAYSRVAFEMENGCYCGLGTLSSGKDKGKNIFVKVHMEAQMVGDLSPDALRNKFVDGDILAKYATGYDVLMCSTIPKCWRETAGGEPKKPALDKREHKSKSHTEKTAVEDDEEPKGLEGDELRHALANRPDTCQSNAPEENDDGDLSDGTVRDCSPDGDSYDRIPRNATAHVVKITRLGCFTTLRHANQTAISAATVAWKPKDASYDAHSFYKDTICPEIKQYEAYVDTEEMLLEFPDFEPGDRMPRYRSWGFVNSQIEVAKRELEGPLDVPIHYVEDLTESYFDELDKNIKETLAQAAVAEVESAGEDEDAEDVEQSNQEVPDRQTSDEEDISEEE